jgi:hypothetical protein
MAAPRIMARDVILGNTEVDVRGMMEDVKRKEEVLDEAVGII